MTNGMKPGSGSDPFEDVDAEEGPAEDDDSTSNGSESVREEIDHTVERGSSTGQTTSGLPFIYARDGVKTARDHTFQLHYQEDTYQQEKQLQTTIEDRLGEDVYKVDLREAAMLAAFENIEDIEAVLREWGYDAD